MMNNIKLKRLEITGLFGYKNVCINFNDVTVIVGKNGLGKTTILKILNALLTVDSDCRELS
ncbi:AAA family ATPase, partial [Escherichia coli]|nr:AAA family ATPase [Escherichia coli]